MQRLSPRFRSQQFFLSTICGDISYPNLQRFVRRRHAGGEAGQKNGAWTFPRPILLTSSRLRLPTFARDKSVLEVKIVDYGQNGNGILLNKLYKISTFKQMQHNLSGCSLRCFVTFKNVSIPHIELICLFHSIF